MKALIVFFITLSCINTFAYETGFFTISNQSEFGGWEYYEYCNITDQMRLERERYKLNIIANTKCKYQIANFVDVIYFKHQCYEDDNGYGVYKSKITAKFMCNGQW